MIRGRAKTVNTARKINLDNIQASDVLCPICRTILVEPVTLPCNHNFCYACFKDTMEKANLVCPLCRLRIGSWLRLTKKDNKLVNESLWNTLKMKYHKEIDNKYKGIENVIEQESPVIVVSDPGEIRKEYEIQKQKDDEEFRKIKEAEEKASEELIKKLREEEEYRLAVEEEKLKFDEEIARKLSIELSQSTSKLVTGKKNQKSGPMDKFVKSEKTTKCETNNFATKEYTCRFLCLEKDPKTNLLQREKIKKLVIPAFQKKIQQIHKIFESEEGKAKNKECKINNSDFELETRFYFKPIYSPNSPPSHIKPPIKVPSRRVSAKENMQISSPTGQTDFQSNVLESAFARINLCFSKAEKDTSTPQSSTSHVPLKRKSTLDIDSIKKKHLKTIDTKNNSNEYIESQNNDFLQNCSTNSALKCNESADSPPFLGFEIKRKLKTDSKPNGLVRENLRKKRLQEKADFEFAKKLQTQLNNEIRINTRSRRGSKRQITLDEIFSA